MHRLQLNPPLCPNKWESTLRLPCAPFRAIILQHPRITDLSATICFSWHLHGFHPYSSNTFWCIVSPHSWKVPMQPHQYLFECNHWESRRPIARLGVEGPWQLFTISFLVSFRSRWQHLGASSHQRSSSRTQGIQNRTVLAYLCHCQNPKLREKNNPAAPTTTLLLSFQKGHCDSGERGSWTS